jgi:hypothetical protein
MAGGERQRERAGNEGGSRSSHGPPFPRPGGENPGRVGKVRRESKRRQRDSLESFFSFLLSFSVELELKKKKANSFAFPSLRKSTMDWTGQKLAESLCIYLTLGFGLVAFVAGYARQDFGLMMKVRERRKSFDRFDLMEHETR